MFYGAYECKVSIVALVKLLQHGVSANDLRLQEIKVRGDQIVTDSIAKTRSQKKLAPDQWTEVPVLAKILKVVINEMGQCLGDIMTNEDDEDDDEDEGDEDCSDEDYEDDAASGMESRYVIYSLLLRNRDLGNINCRRD